MHAPSATVDFPVTPYDPLHQNSEYNSNYIVTEKKSSISEIFSKYFPNLSSSDFIIKFKAERTGMPKHPIPDSKASHLDGYLRSNLLEMQNKVIDNPSNVHDCLYGALAIEIFGKKKAKKDIQAYVGILRNAIANYILDNRSCFIPSMAYVDDKKISERHEVRLVERCNKIRNKEWGSGIELAAVSAMLQVPIHVFYTGAPMKMGTEGIEDGVIQPNVIIGSEFTGPAIRLKYTASQYNAMKLVI
jgi:hypothetical protein